VPPFLPLLRILAESCPWLERRTLTTGFPFSGKIAVLAGGYPGDGREALCSFSALHDVRHFDLTCISVIHTIDDIVSSNTKPLQPGELPTTFISTLTVPAEVMYTRTRDTRGGGIASGHSEIVAEPGPVRTLDFVVSTQSPFLIAPS
jgi:hypothetical protein